MKPHDKGHAIREEKDSLGVLQVPADRLWGAQTQRALEHFAWQGDRVPLEIIYSLVMIKEAAALVNADLGLLDNSLAGYITAAAQEVLAGTFDDHFPLSVWQSGSGTQSNMNVNEVLANRACELAGSRAGSQDPVHPNDHVNRCQSTNDTFPAAMHMAAATAMEKTLLGAVQGLEDALQEKSCQWDRLVKTGRTHLQDAVPLTLGQEFSGYTAQIKAARVGLSLSLPGLYELPLGATAVGTGLNAHPEFGYKVVAHIRETTGLPFTVAQNNFASLAAHDAMVAASGACRNLAVALMKIANDIRWLASGPHCGIGELILPANEPGSSIMPGKVNPSQCEALTMLCVHIMGLDSSIALAGSQGNFELNAFKPVMGYSLLRAITLLSHGIQSFTRHAIQGLEPDRERIQWYLEHSLMLATALAPAIGYDMAAKIAQTARQEGLTLRQACAKLGCLSEEEFSRIVRPEKMVSPGE